MVSPDFAGDVIALLLQEAPPRVTPAAIEAARARGPVGILFHLAHRRFVDREGAGAELVGSRLGPEFCLTPAPRDPRLANHVADREVTHAPVIQAFRRRVTPSGVWPYHFPS